VHIQAAIVGKMKAQKILESSLLIQEVIEQLNSRFTPEISIIQVNLILVSLK
jgi:hypothetical protein